MSTAECRVGERKRRIFLPKSRTDSLVASLPDGSQRLGRRLLELGEAERFVERRARVVLTPALLG